LKRKEKKREEKKREEALSTANSVLKNSFIYPSPLEKIFFSLDSDSDQNALSLSLSKVLCQLNELHAGIQLP